MSQFADVMVLPTQIHVRRPSSVVLRHGKTGPASSSNMVRVHTPWRAIMIQTQHLMTVRAPFHQTIALGQPRGLADALIQMQSITMRVLQQTMAPASGPHVRHVQAT